jgi:electron transfer flavoprotein alpha subunit
MGKNVMPRVAALLDVPRSRKIIAGRRECRHLPRPIYAGNAIQTVQSSDAKKVLTVRAASFDRRRPTAARRRSSRAGRRDAGLSSFVGEELSPRADRPELTSARDHHLRRPRPRLRGELHQGPRSLAREHGL